MAPPWFAIGLIRSVICLTSVGWLPSYTTLGVAVSAGWGLAGLAHPDIFSQAGALSNRHHSLSVGVFMSGGRLGTALGPIVAILVVKWWGME